MRKNRTTMSKISIQFSVLLVLSLACSEPPKQNMSSEEIGFQKLKLSSEMEWEKLNPARGDKSPQAATLWGDRKDTVATGFLAKFVDGFSSPPHIHNVTYRAVVIKGAIHNDDPNATPMWMEQGSFWTQPKGEPHITSANGKENIAYVEIDSGPYLVRPTREAFDQGEKPVNIDANNIVWLGSNVTDWIGENTNAEIGFLWSGKNNLRGLFIKFPTGFEGYLETDGSILHSVVINGEITYQKSKDRLRKLDPGSYFGSSGRAAHLLRSESSESLLYIRTNGSIRINP